VPIIYRRRDMPTIFFYGPRLDKDKSRDMIQSFTETASRLTGIERSAFVIYLRESGPENVGVGGELLEDRLKSREQK
jgi:phenylpyruvate tautomerase PptA (4-oxalocrotonate tautomerase family)